MITLMMRYIAFFAVLVSCSEKQKTTQPTPIAKQLEETDSTEFSFGGAQPLAFEIDSNLVLIAKHIQEKGSSLTNMKKHYTFNRDTVYTIDSISYFSYDVSTILDYYQRRSFQYNSRPKIIAHFAKADTCYGITMGADRNTEMSMIEVFRFPTEQQAIVLETIYNEHHPPLFIKTLSFVKAIDNKLYVFHSRSMGASWTLKRYFEWFENNVAKTDA